MNWRHLSLAVAIACAPAFAAHAGEHHHDHASVSAPAKLQLDAGKKWQTDVSLREAMDRVNQAMKEALPRIHGKGFTDADYQALAGTVNREIAYAVENCHLAPKADAMLHLVIADLAAGAKAMAGETENSSRHQGAATVLRALKSYGRYFDHPGWQAAGG